MRKLLIVRLAILIVGTIMSRSPGPGLGTKGRSKETRGKVKGTF
jgi:hypothetical protein